ncbi:hypothetical protein ACFX13_034532 [Malus domestica]
MGGLQLLDSGSDSENENGNDDVPQLKINEDFARRYEHNKKREELQRYEELKKRGLVADPSEDSDSEPDFESDDDYVHVANSKKRELEFLDGLLKVKKQDPILKNKDVVLFNSDGTEIIGNNGGEGKAKNKKKMYLKDVNAKHLMEDGPELAEEDDKNIDKNSKVYNEEQERIRREFLQAAAAEEDDDDGEFLIEKNKNAAGNDDDDDTVDNDQYEKALDECFPESDENAMFLKKFFKDQLWKEDKDPELKDEDLEMVSEDEMEIERQEEYEYRFQENAGDRIMGHSRQVEGSVRKKVKARKEQRKSKEERMEIARLEREEELRHLKNLKKKENDEKVKKIMEIAGLKEGEESTFDPKELEKEYDPQEYDRMMKKAFGEEYYQAEDADLERYSDMEEDDEIEKPDFDKEDELLGLPKGWETVGSSDGFLAAREKRAKKEMMDEYYKLDYEDTIGDLKTRFKYAKIKPNRYGLTTAEILAMDEKELNQYVSLKKLAPYTEKEWKVPNNKRMEIKQKAKEIFRQGNVGNKKNRKKLRISDAAKDSSLSKGATGQSSMSAREHGKELVGDSNGGKTESRSARRRRHQAARKLPASRLMAYGVVPVKSKKKGKH